MLIALRMRLIANSRPDANPNRRAIRLSSIVSLRVNVSTRAERIRSPERGERGVPRRYLHGDPADRAIRAGLLHLRPRSVGARSVALVAGRAFRLLGMGD